MMIKFIYYLPIIIVRTIQAQALPSWLFKRTYQISDPTSREISNQLRNQSRLAQYYYKRHIYHSQLDKHQ